MVLKDVGSLTSLQLFTTIFNNEFFGLLKNIVNRNLINRQKERATTIKELQQFYGIMILLENTYGNNNRSLRKHLKSVFDQFGKIKKLGQDRFQLLRLALVPTIDELNSLCDILITNSQR
jgi:hypothetical protein